MILYDPGLNMVYKAYGIMLPISPSRADRIMDFLEQAAVLETPGVGPVYTVAEALDFLGEPRASDEALENAVISREDLERVHQKEFIATLYEDGPDPGGLVQALLNAWELIDDQGRLNRYEPDKAMKPLQELFRMVRAQVGGTYLAARLALSAGATTGTPPFCYYLGGGMHHARYDSGAGFCLLNDIMIAARKLHAENRVNLIWVVDVDAHKGCGTAELVCFAREKGDLGVHTNDPTGGTAGHVKSRDILNLSIHMARGWPLDAETLSTAQPGRAPRVPGDVEIPIEQGAEADYISGLARGLHRLEALSGGVKPDLVLVVDGADPYEHDGLLSSGLLKLTLEQCVQRDRLIYDYLQERNIPSAWIMAGGYGERAWEPGAHFLGILGLRMDADNQ
ncbi:MAG: histone deacetylase [Treponema sp.]|jgi:acetoin utilization deacetylase AcuC-like enzyme|nr:histone deacetylase [Treponema sp.]